MYAQFSFVRDVKFYWLGASEKIGATPIVHISPVSPTVVLDRPCHAHLSMIETAGVIPAPVHTNTTDASERAKAVPNAGQGTA